MVTKFFLLATPPPFQIVLKSIVLDIKNADYRRDKV
jgi:hypothetical protein